MNVNELLSIGIVGVVVSLAVEWIQRKYGTGSTTTKALSILISVLVGGAYFLIRNTAWWIPMLGILGSASTVYALFFSGKTQTDASVL